MRAAAAKVTKDPARADGGFPARPDRGRAERWGPRGERPREL